MIRMCTPYSGGVRSAYVETAPRFNARRLSALAAAPHVRAYVDAFAAAYLTPSAEV
jgi:hypothetical protein